ncbi:MAG: GNAT family N-acetyltransferase [Rhizobiales bacterium 65-9]|nr:N-acetyltransferase [Hyphomicrobiales bacterium]OJY32836.1 MAG: GNAT family N-acetyltransferase [Rhizobiales bacterium 65-9]
MIKVVQETIQDFDAREALLDACFGDARFAKTSERLREGRLPARGLALVARDESRMVGTIRLWNVTAGPGCPALLLGPLAVDPARQGEGLGALLMQDAIGRAKALGHKAILLVGDAPYYARFGFSAAATEALWLPGPVERERFLARELHDGALAKASGLVQATGERTPSPDLNALIAAQSGGERGGLRLKAA